MGALTLALAAEALLNFQFQASLDLFGPQPPVTVQDCEPATHDGRRQEPTGAQEHGGEPGRQQEGSRQPAGAQEYGDAENGAGERCYPADDNARGRGGIRIVFHGKGKLVDEHANPQQCAEDAEEAAKDLHEQFPSFESTRPVRAASI